MKLINSLLQKESITASMLAKAAGIKSLKQVSEATGASAQTLINWHKHKPKLFAVVLLGAKVAITQHSD
jgi:hypothetical protein